MPVRATPPTKLSAGLTIVQTSAPPCRSDFELGRSRWLPTLAQVVDAAVFLASDRARAITGAVVDLSCGIAVRNSAWALVGVLD
jgi:hypothetical protein